MTFKWETPDSANQSASQYKANIDNVLSIAKHLAGAFVCYAQTSPNMTVVVDAGVVSASNVPSELSVQQSSSITAPIGSNQRYDRVVMNAATGIISVVTGTASNSPSSPNVPAGNLPVACIGPLTANTSAITQNLITDERSLWPSINATANLSLGNATIIRSTFAAINAPAFPTNIDIANIPKNMVEVGISFRGVQMNAANSQIVVYFAGQNGTFETTIGYNGTVVYMTGNAGGNNTFVTGSTFNGGVLATGSFVQANAVLSGEIIVRRCDGEGQVYECSVSLNGTHNTSNGTGAAIRGEWDFKFNQVSDGPLRSIRLLPFQANGTVFTGGNIPYHIDTVGAP